MTAAGPLKFKVQMNEIIAPQNKEKMKSIKHGGGCLSKRKTVA